jgi:predicted glycosyltransferase involved in capsule biosynthesis
MGRLGHLKQTIRSVVSQPSSEYVLVDYACPDDCGKWAGLNFPSVRLVSIAGKSKFNLSAARNAGARIAKYDWLFFLDVDVELADVVTTPILAKLAQGKFFVSPKKSAGHGGIILCHAEDFSKIGGFRDDMEGWGWEDKDIKHRLVKNGMKKIKLPFPQAFRHIEHEDFMRVAFYDEKRTWMSARLNRKKSKKADRL